MSEEYRGYSPKGYLEVGHENRFQYPEESWPMSADIRRYLTLKYSVSQRDMWSEQAQAVVETGARRVVEYGCSSGYILRKMLEHGFDGEYVGVDKNDSYLFLVDESIRKAFPDTKARISFVSADAQHVTLEELGGELFDAAITANTLYHVEKPGLLLKSANEAVVDQGFQFFSTKGIEHQDEIWTIANQVALQQKANPIHSFYWHFPPAQLDQAIKGSKRFTPLPELKGEQVEASLFPDDESGEGWSDVKMTVLSLVPIMRVKATGMPPGLGEAIAILESDLIKQHLFKRRAAQNNGIFEGRINMSWRGCINNNPRK